MEPEVSSVTHLRWVLGQLLGLIALAAALGLEAGSTPMIVVLMALIVGGTAMPRLLTKIQGHLVGFVPKLIIVYILVDFLISLGDVVAPLVRVMALLLSYRALEFRTPRQDRQLVLLSLVLLLLTGTITTDLSFAFQLLVFVPIAMLSLALSLADEERARMNEERSPSWANFNWRHWRRDLFRNLDRRLVATGAVMYLIFTFAALGLFWLLPRFEIGHQLPFMRLSTGKSYTGFSESVSFGSVVDIQQDFSVALRVDGPPSLAVKDPYWRMMVLDEYYGGGFRQSISAERSNRRLSDSTLIGNRRNVPALDTELTCYFEGGVSRQLPLVSGFGEVNFTSLMDLKVNTAVKTFGLREASANLLVYKIQQPDYSLLIAPSQDDKALNEANQKARFTDFESQRIEYPFTMLEVRGSDGSHEFLTTLVDELWGEIGAKEKESSLFIEAATVWLQEGRGYSLKSTLGESREPVLEWLKTSGPGHCELYASGLILIARTAGIPARLVTGFRGGSWNAFENYLTVRNSNAHAWVEYFDPVVGWRRADPTPGIGANGSSVATTGLEANTFGVPVDSTAAAFADSLRLIWYRRIVDFDQKDQAEMISGVQHWFEVIGTTARALAVDVVAAVKEWLKHPLELNQTVIRLLIFIVSIFGLVLIGRDIRRRVSRREGGSHEKSVRRKAEEWLRWLDSAELTAGADGLKGDLLSLRYAKLGDWHEPTKVFERCRMARKAERLR